MPVDQGAAIVVHLHDIDAHFLCEVDVIGGKGVVGLDGLHVRDLKPGVGKGHFSRWHGRSGHVTWLDPGKAIGKDFYFYLWIGTHFLGPVPGGNDEATVSVGRERLGSEAVHTSLLNRFQLGQTLGRGWGHTLILVDSLGLLQGHQILLVAPQDHRITLLLCDPHFPCYVLSGP